MGASQSRCPSCCSSHWWLQDENRRSWWSCRDRWHREEATRVLAYPGAP